MLNKMCLRDRWYLGMKKLLASSFPTAKIIAIALVFFPFLSAADTLYINGNIRLVDQDNRIVDSLYEARGIIQFVGDAVEGKQLISAKTSIVDLQGKTVIPGFIEGHGHLMSLGLSQLNVDLSAVANYGELVRKVAIAVDAAKPGEWIIGRGWHQSKWSPQPKNVVAGFQTHHRLSDVSPDNPVYLVHASGHAGFANAKAMTLAGITKDTIVADDGEIIRDQSGEATGVFNERAQALIRSHIPATSKEQQLRALKLALNVLAKNGVTSFQDAGVSQDTIDLYRQLDATNELTSRLWVMLSGSDKALLDRWFESGPEIGNYLTVRAVKLVADGALGSRGAWLLKPYTDRPETSGLATMPIEYMADVSHQAYQHGFQIGIHAIGDQANRAVLDIYDDLFDGKDRGVRFRVEHAQHIANVDIPRFGQLGVIASVQGIHMSSDRPWAIDRLGLARIVEGAYVWRKLLDSNAILINGTDVPVEPVNPFASYYALVSRRTLAGKPIGGYEPSQKLSRLEALQAYTIAPAYGAFEEHLKGSLEVGKWADFVVLNQDLITVEEDEILNTKVLRTIVGGTEVYNAIDEV